VVDRRNFCVSRDLASGKLSPVRDLRTSRDYRIPGDAMGRVKSYEGQIDGPARNCRRLE